MGDWNEATEEGMRKVRGGEEMGKVGEAEEERKDRGEGGE